MLAPPPVTLPPHTDCGPAAWSAPLDRHFARQVHDRPQAPAVVADGCTWSYRALDQRSDILAGRLAGLGVGRGDLVGMFLPRAPEAVAAMLAIIKLGAAYVPFDPAYPLAARRVVAADCRPVAMVAARALAQAESFWTCPTLWLNGVDGLDAAAPAPALPLPRTDGESLACVMYTSGSTGTPKGVMVPHRGIARLVLQPDYVNLSAAETILAAAPLAFDASSFEIWGALLNGARLVMLPAAVPSLDEIVAAVARHGVTTLWLTAGLFHMMVEHRLEGLRPLRQLLAGGDVISAAAVRRVRQALPHCQVINGYGPTENTTFTCCYRVPPDFAGDSLPIGRPIAGTRIAILDDAAQPVPPGETGQLAAGGAGVALGYLGDPVRTAEKFIADPAGGRMYLTGDLACLRADGVVLFLGRADRQVKINGRRVELDEIEAVLRRCPMVAEVAVLYAAWDDGPKQLTCFVQPAAGAQDLEAVLRRHARALLAEHMVPGRIAIVAAFPMTPSGKIDRRALRPPAPAAPAPVPAGTPEERLRRLWCAALGRADVGLDENFFDLGGTSLHLIGVHAQLPAHGFAPVAVLELFAHPTIRRLAARLAGAGAESAADTRLDAARLRARRQSEAMRRVRAGGRG